MPVTIKDIAQKLNISHSTVSRALRNHPNISEYTCALVQRTAKSMGYRVNQPARALASQRVQVISLIIPDVVDPFYARIIEGVDQIAHEREYALLLYVTHSNARRERAAVDGASMRRYDGTILFRRHLSLVQLRAAVRAGTPFVLLTRHEAGLGVDSIRVDDVDGGYKATSHLLELGHRRIACLTGPPGNQETEDRRHGFEQAHRDYGLSWDPELIWDGDFTERAGLLAAERWSAMSPSDRPTAVFASNDQMAIGLIRRSGELGISVPRQLSVIGYDDIEPSRYTVPTLTTVRQPTREMGCRAAEILISRIEGGTSPPQEILLKTELVVRESTSPCGNQAVRESPA